MWLEKKYISLLGSRLKNFRHKDNNLYNFSCPFCSDSSKHKKRARGYLLFNGEFYFYCHNCTANYRFKKFLEKIDPLLHEQYLLDKFNDSHPSIPELPDRKAYAVENTLLDSLQKISQLPHDHYAKKYVITRQIPTYFHTQMYFCPKFKSWVNSIIPDKFENVSIEEARIIIPLVDDKKNVTGVIGRSLRKNSSTKYITIKFDENKTKVYGLDRIDFNRTFFVLEGPIDSMFVPNSLATCGAALLSEVKKLNKPMQNMILVYDNQPLNSEVANQMLTAIQKGCRVFIWPSTIKSKDINEYVLTKISGEYCKTEKIELLQKSLVELLKTRSFVGLEAELEFMQWNRAKLKREAMHTMHT